MRIVKILSSLCAIAIMLISCGPRTVVTVKKTGEKVSISTSTSVSDSSSSSVDIDVNPTIQLGEPIASLSSSELSDFLVSHNVPLSLPSEDCTLSFSVAELKELFPDYRAVLYEKRSKKTYSQNNDW